jgi:hypothetical protein
VQDSFKKEKPGQSTQLLEKGCARFREKGNSLRKDVQDSLKKEGQCTAFGSFLEKGNVFFCSKLLNNGRRQVFLNHLLAPPE